MVMTVENTAAFTLVAEKLNILHGRDGDLSTLTTTEKADLVGAINEVKAAVDAAQATGNAAATINDTDDAGSSTTFSAMEIVARLAAVAAAATADTTAQISAALEGEDLSDLAAEIAALQAADLNLISADAAQTFTDTQKAQARKNIRASSQADLDTTNADLTALSAGVGDHAAYDPVATLNSILTF